VILIAYDGSEDAQEAIKRAAVLFPSQPVTVLTVWQRFVESTAAAGAGMGLMVDYDAIDSATEQAATEQAAAGVQVVRDAGLEATPRVAVASATIAWTILAEAAAVDADAVLMGTRGLTGIRSLMLGSVSNAVVQHADRPVVIVPSAGVAEERDKHRRG
jgi:nucleotide-binding universal stress UspA family protein